MPPAAGNPPSESPPPGRPPNRAGSGVGRQKDTWPLGAAFVGWTVAAVGMTVVMQRLGAPLIIPEVPAGILSFEFAGTVARAEAMVEAWGPAGQAAARRSLLVDVLFIASYAPAIGLGCRWVASRSPTGQGIFAALGRRLGWAQVVAAACDLGENALLWAFLQGDASDARLQLAAGLAGTKFALIAAGLLYLVLGLVGVAVRGLMSRRSSGAARG